MIDAFKMAECVTEETCVGVTSRSYPLDYGNCFSVRCSDGSHYKIVNFVLENLEEAVRRLKSKGSESWPFKIKPISDRHAVLHDDRIPDNWYSQSFCEICCPKSLLPTPQLLAHERQCARGERKEGDGHVSYIMSRRPEL